MFQETKEKLFNDNRLNKLEYLNLDVYINRVPKYMQ